MVSEDNGALKVEMNQFEFPDGEMFVFTKEEWVLDVSDPAHQVVSMKVKVEGASYDDGTGRVDVPTIPFQVSLFANVPDPAEEDSERTRVGGSGISFNIQSEAPGEGEFVEYYFDFADNIASYASTHNPEEVVWAMLVETVRWPGTHQATYWLDDIKIGDAVIPYIPSDDATIHATTNGTLGDGEITMVDSELSVTAFLLGLTVEENAACGMLVSSGGEEVDDQNRTKMTAGMVVEVTSENGTVKEYSITTAPVGIGMLNKENVAIYPNPTSGLLNISNTASFSRITISSVTGQTILSKEVTGSSQQLDISEYEAGIYFIVLDRQKHDQVIRKLVKQ